MSEGAVQVFRAVLKEIKKNIKTKTTYPGLKVSNVSYLVVLSLVR